MSIRVFLVRLTDEGRTTMCPACITTAAVVATGATAMGGLGVLLVRALSALRGGRHREETT